jgi:hypothetical protein
MDETKIKRMLKKENSKKLCIAPVIVVFTIITCDNLQFSRLWMQCWISNANAGNVKEKEER